MKFPAFRSSLLVLVALLAGCTGLPDGITPVERLDLRAYQGLWYEIARLDHSFEEGLSHVTAEYALESDGAVTVINRGLDAETGQWKEADGRAVLVEDSLPGHLKVSFFGPFYASYVVFFQSEDQRISYVTGYNREYLWLLSREPTIDADRLNHFKDYVRARGFDLSELIIVDQTRHLPQD